MAGEKQFDRKGGEQILTREKKKKKKNRSRREEILLLAIKWALSRGLGKRESLFRLRLLHRESESRPNSF